MFPVVWLVLLVFVGLWRRGAFFLAGQSALLSTPRPAPLLVILPASVAGKTYR